MNKDDCDKTCSKSCDINHEYVRDHLRHLEWLKMKKKVLKEEEAHIKDNWQHMPSYYINDKCLCSWCLDPQNGWKYVVQDGELIYYELQDKVKSKIYNYNFKITMDELQK